MKKLKRTGTLLLCLLTVFLSLPRALAAGAIQIAQESSLTVVYTDSGTPLTGAQFALYRVADVSPEGRYSLTGDFADCPIDLKDLSASAALAGAGYAQLNGIPPLATGTTDMWGRVTFSGLTPGLFLVVGGVHVQNGTVYSIAPLFAALPVQNYSTNDWEYSATVTPKHSEAPDQPSGGFVERRVLKIWDDEGLEAERPAQIVVHLLRSGKIFDTAILSEKNNWTYTWSGLDAGYDWTVMEVVPDGYTVEVERVGVTYVITNKKSGSPDSEPSPTPTPTPVPSPSGNDPEPTPTPAPTSTPDDAPTLPQTGQLWWPVPVLAAAGLLLLLIGCIRKRGAGDEE